MFAIAAQEEAQATQAAEDGGPDGTEAAVYLVALGGGRLPPPRGGALPHGADDLAVGEGLGGGALPDLRRAEQLRLPGKCLPGMVILIKPLVTN